MNLIDVLKNDEGSNIRKNGQHMPYEDSVGKMTLGYGRNIEDNGISEEEANSMLLNDIARVMAELTSRLDFWPYLSEPRREVLINMSFNLGITKFMGFKKMLIALDKEHYGTASREMLDSKWARQVGNRATRLAGLMLRG